MSKRIEAQLRCPSCGKWFDFTLYRSIWGEEPTNRELVMQDKINVATCPACKQTSKVPYPFLYTNAIQKFALWWEPEYDKNIDTDCEGYRSVFGAKHYLATAPRIKDWDEFKQTILKFERGELGTKSACDVNSFIKGMNEQLKNLNYKDANAGTFARIRKWWSNLFH